MRALVTGAAGFLGRHLTAALSGAGYEVLAVDTAGLASVDCRDFFRHVATRYDLVVHAAGGGSGPHAAAAGLELDAAMFTWAARARPGRVVYLSGGAVYPVALQRPSWTGRRLLREDDVNLAAPRLPDGLHGWAKLTGELQAAEACAGGLAVTVVRPFSVYGTGQGEDRPFGAFLARARRREDPFMIQGDGKQVRDWIHVDDVCTAVLTLVADDIDGPVNLGTGAGTTVAELAAIVCSDARHRPVFQYRGDMPAGVRYRVADVTRLHRIYVPQVSLAEGVRRALA